MTRTVGDVGWDVVIKICHLSAIRFVTLGAPVDQAICTLFDQAIALTEHYVDHFVKEDRQRLRSIVLRYRQLSGSKICFDEPVDADQPPGGGPPGAGGSQDEFHDELLFADTPPSQAAARDCEVHPGVGGARKGARAPLYPEAAPSPEAGDPSDHSGPADKHASMDDQAVLPGSATWKWGSREVAQVTVSLRSLLVEAQVAPDRRPRRVSGEMLSVVNAPILPERYDQRHLLGQGGMGEVHCVYDRYLNREMALKIIHPRLSGDRDSECRFLAEAQATAQLQHPGIIPVHDIGKLSDGRFYFTIGKVPVPPMR